MEQISDHTYFPSGQDRIFCFICGRPAGVHARGYWQIDCTTGYANGCRCPKCVQQHRHAQAARRAAARARQINP